MRHGKPTFTGSSKISSIEMAEWISQYDLSDTGNNIPPQSSKVLASSALYIISSPLPRALSSLTALGCNPDRIDEVFREANLSTFHIPAFRFSPIFWATVFRIMWLCGISRNVESLKMAKLRAAQAADILLTSVKVSNGPVLLMGHGMMNRLIAKELISMGWKESRRQGLGYWNASIYSLPEQKS
ncbi:TPA: histidine phosphatase family protein [Providencia rettgeri]